MAIVKYEKGISNFVKETTDTRAKDDIINAYNYVAFQFATELALANRDYDLGISDIRDIRKIQIKAYHEENKIRGYLGLDALPEINDSVL